MELKKLRFINFKKFREEQEIDLQDSNLITGKNGEGKTTIKEAIIFCLYNSTPEGSLSLSDKYISNGKAKTFVELTFEYKGVEHVVRRERTQTQTKITYLDNSQSDEDAKITQQELNTLIPSFKDFSAVFNIGWFMSLNEQTKRKYILNLTPSTNYIELFKNLKGDVEDIKKYNLSFDNLDKTHKELLKQKLQNTERIKELKILIKNNIIGDSPEITKQDISDKMKKAKMIQKKNYEIGVKLKEYDRLLKKNAKIKEDNEKIKDKISRMKILDIEKPDKDAIYELNNLKKEYSKKIDLPENICPTCLQSITKQHRDKIDKINLKNKKKLEEIEKNIEKEKEKYQIELEKWEKNEKNKEELNELKTYIKEPIKLFKKPAEKQAKIGVEINRLEKYQIEYIKEKNALNIFEEEKEKKEAEKKRNKEELNKIVISNRKLISLINLFSPKGIPAEEMKIKLQPLKEQFQKLIPNSDIVTLQLLKNKLEYKEVFHITIDGKDYSKLSTGEKARVDISLSQIINSLLQEKINIFFLDNAEVLDSSISIPKQSFICKVNNQSLKIN